MAGLKISFVVLIALCIANQASCGKAPRDAENTGETLQLQDVIARGRDTIQNVTGQVTELLGLEGLPDSAQVATVLSNQTQALSDTIQQVIGNIQKETAAHGGSFTGLLEAMTARLTETVNTLQASSPGVTKGLSESQSQITASLNVVLDEAGKLAKALGGEASTVQEDLAKLARTTVEQAVAIGKQVEKNVKTAIEENRTPTT